MFKHRNKDMTKKTDLLDKKRYGDMQTVGQMLGRTTEACRMALSRGEGRAYEEVYAALQKVIETREQLIKR